MSRSSASYVVVIHLDDQRTVDDFDFDVAQYVVGRGQI